MSIQDFQKRLRQGGNSELFKVFNELTFLDKEVIKDVGWVRWH